MITKEEIESRGWVFDGYVFTKGNIWKDNGQGASLKVTEHGNVVITTTDCGWTKDGPESSVKFNGKCNDLQTLDFITSLINITC